jgi:N-acetylneuraminic acid mutarotase
VDPWERVSDDGAPEGRAQHVAVWTGSEMVVWGGAYSSCDACTLSSGGLYDPSTRTWRDTSGVDAPAPRRSATAVWTGTEMLVWGGYNDGHALGSGGRFDPATNTWRVISLAWAPSPRYGHTAVWTGTEMIVWGGTDGTDRFASGARYAPATDTWTPMAVATLARSNHRAVWLDGAMLVYGGQGDDGVDPDAYLPSAMVSGGVSYEPATNHWSNLPTTGQPGSRAFHTATVVGDNLLVWGGYNGMSMLSTGATFGPNAWLATLAPEPAPRRFHTAVTLLTPSPQVLVWGGEDEMGDLDSGGAFDLATNGWAALPTALSARRHHTAVSTGDAMLIWGGIHGTTYLYPQPSL